MVAINRALAIAEVHGAGAGLDALQEVAADVRLAEYQPYWAARGELLAKTRANGEHRAYEIAIGLERAPAVRTVPAAASGDAAGVILRLRGWVVVTFISA
jgi:RNA polymerase sigma-70 factor (ECF subfamily)